MENLESLKRELVEFTPERFNTVYRTMIDVAQTSDREYEVLDALSLIADCDLILQQVNETLKNLPDEAHCERCADKEKLLELQNETIEMKDETIQLLKEDLEKYRDKSIKLLEEKAGITPNNNLKVGEKEV
jgi:hypothetical protein